MHERPNTETEAANLALGHATQPPIGDLATDTSIRGRACRQFFGTARDSLLREKWWNFAKAWVTPPSVAGQSLGKLKTRFIMPADCLRVRFVQDHNDEEWDLENATVTISGVPVEQTVLATNISAPVVCYTRRIERVSLWDPVFCDGFGYDLAARIARKVGRSRAWAMDMQALAMQKIDSAAQIDSKEQSRQQITRQTSWINGRFGFNTPFGR